MEYGTMEVISITTLTYLAAMAAKAAGLSGKWIPVLCGGLGLLLGIGACAAGIPGFPAQDFLTAAAVGAASGLAATGTDQAVKQLSA